MLQNSYLVAKIGLIQLRTSPPKRVWSELKLVGKHYGRRITRKRGAAFPAPSFPVWRIARLARFGFGWRQHRATLLSRGETPTPLHFPQWRVWYLPRIWPTVARSSKGRGRTSSMTGHAQPELFFLCFPYSRQRERSPQRPVPA